MKPEIKFVKTPEYNILSENVIVWENASKRNYKQLTFLLGLLIFLLVMGIYKASKTGSFWNFYTCLGTSYILFLIMAIVNQYEKKSKMISVSTACYKKRNEQKNYTEYLFNEEKIIIQDLDSYAELKWSAFSHYELYKGYLLLFFHNYETSSIPINSELLSKENFSLLIQLVKQKLPAKE